MKLKPEFEIVRVADDYTLIPLGEQMEQFCGTVVLNEVSAFLLKLMKDDVSKEELIRALTAEYEVDDETAQADVEEALAKMTQSCRMDSKFALYSSLIDATL